MQEGKCKVIAITNQKEFEKTATLFNFGVVFSFTFDFNNIFLKKLKKILTLLVKNGNVDSK
jgi:hypothetical protein